MTASTKDAWREVDEILNWRFKNGKMEYLVKWKRSNDDDNSDDEDMIQEWLPEEQCNCPKLIADLAISIGVFKASYEVEGIIDSIEDPDGNVEYLVKWKGWDSARESTWVKEEDMNCDHLIQQFENGHAYRDRKILRVEKIHGFAGEYDGVDNYTIVHQGRNKATKKRYTFDQLYRALNGRKALNEFTGEFL